MKRIYLLGLFMTLLTGLSFHAKAELTVTVTWDTPGSIAPYAEIGKSTYTPVAVSQTATSQTFTLDETYGYLKIFPADGYYIEGVTCTKERTLNPSSYVKPTTGELTYTPANGLSISLNSTYTGDEVHLTVKKIVRSTPFTVNLNNGLTSIKDFYFSGSNYRPELKNGKNTYYYDPNIDGNQIYLQFVLPTEEQREAGYPYTLTLNDEPASSLYSAPLVIDNAYNCIYKINLDPDANDLLYIKVFENASEEPDTYNLTINYGEGMKGCLSNIFDRRSGKMTLPSEYEGGIITGLTDVLEGTELRLNFLSDDFTITEVLVNGVNMTNYLVNEGDNIQQYFTLTMTENTSITINGRATVWNDIVYTGYVSDPEGLQFGLSMDDYDLKYTVVGDVSGQTYGVMTMPEGSKEIQVTVSEKNNNGKGSLYFKPATGYFITKCYIGTPNDSETSGTASINAAMNKDDNRSFYMLIDKMDPDYTADLDVHVSGYPDVTYLKSASTYSEQNDNPAQKKIQLTAGESVVTFVPNYDNPFILSLNQNQTGRIYLDGVEVKGSLNTDSNGTDYTLDLYAPKAGETNSYHSKIDVYFTGTPAMSSTSLNLENNATAEFFYSPALRAADPTMSVITGTEMYVKPTSDNAVVVYKGKAQILDADGMFHFTTTGAAADNVVTVTGPKSTKIAGMIPKTGTAVKSLDEITLLVPMSIDGKDVSLDADIDILNQTVITLDGTTVATIQPITNLSEIDTTTEGNNVLVPIKLSKKITEAGEDYYVKVPQGAFVEKSYDETTQSMVAVPGGYITAAFSGRFDVDPTLIADPVLSPEAGSTVKSLSSIAVTFSDVEEIEEVEGANITLVGPEYNANAFEVAVASLTKTVTFSFPAATTDGTYTLTVPAGALMLDGTASKEITATYTLDKGWVLTPAPGSQIESLEFVLTFPKAKDVEFTGSSTSFNLGNATQTYAAPGMECVKVESASVPTFTLSLPDGAQKPANGDYKLIIDEGTFTIDGEDSPEIYAEYTLEAEVSAEYACEPYNGTIVLSEYGINFGIIFDEAATVTEPSVSNVKLTLDGSEIPSSDFAVMAEANMLLMMVYGADYIKTGTLKLEIPAGAFKVGDIDSPAISEEWNVVEPRTFKTEMSCGENSTSSPQNAKDLGTIYIYFPEATTAKVDDEMPAPLLYDTGYSYSVQGTIEILGSSETPKTRAASGSGVTAKLTFDPAPTKAATYNLRMNEGKIILDDVYAAPEISQQYENVVAAPIPTGVYELFADESGNVTVYTLDGQIVLNNVPAEQLRDLKKGLYIINGKKTLVK
ncbi:MAG: hypothetical protein K2K97_03030 [Muribaculaceae bacterium]|nr:hypothetical protein [Muribaculaceae bacterium]